jgi:hypothetical protein
MVTALPERRDKAVGFIRQEIALEESDNEPHKNITLKAIRQPREGDMGRT